MNAKTHYIDGDWFAGKGEHFRDLNPATQEEIWSGQAATNAQVDDAVKAGQGAFEKWASLDLSERLSYLNHFCELLHAHKSELAESISLDTGKPLWESLTEVGAMINKVTISQKAYEQRTGLTKKALPDGKFVTCHRPHGVVAVLGPFNFPAHLPNGHIIPALLAGNTIVFKPSELTPLVAEKMMHLWEQVGLPKGVINLIQGGCETGQALSQSDINGLFFTGSYATGLSLHQQFADQLEKIIALELGGNNPLIVADVKDIKAAAYQTIQSAFITAGQRCTCARRLILPESDSTDAFLSVLKELTQTIVVGQFDDPQEPFMGPVISVQSANHLLDAQELMLENGAEVLLKMQKLPRGDAYVSPGIIDVTGMQYRADQEYFGPLLQVIRVKDFSAAIQEANNTRFGLSAGILTDDAKLFQQFYVHSRAGILNWNKPTTGAASDAPFGGTGRSGNHRPAAYYAADYCAYPVASMQSETLTLPEKLSPGIRVNEDS